MMKMFFKKTAVFLLLCPLAYLSCIVFIVVFLPGAKTALNINYKQTTGHSHSRFQEAKQVGNVDILFIGPSTTYMGFDPRFFEEEGLKVFNLGSSAQTPIQTNVLLNRFLDQLNPKLVVYNPHPGTFVYDGTESTTDIISNLPVGMDTFELALSNGNLHAINTFFFRLFVDIFNTEKNFTEPKVIGEDTYIGRGYVSKTLTVTPEELSKTNLNKSTGEWEPLDFQIEYFEKNIELIKKKNAELIFVIPPVNSKAYDRLYFSNPEFQNYIKKSGRFIDYNKHIHLNDSLHFSDATVHLNQEGVNAFNKFIITRGDFEVE